LPSHAQPSMAPATAPDGAPADLVVSSAPGPAGATQVLSRYRDDVWELWPYFEQSNLTPSSKRIDWANVPEQFRPDTADPDRVRPALGRPDERLCRLRRR